MTYPEAFERLWAEYPQRPNNPKKPAFKQYQRRLLEGVSVLTLLGAVMNYAGQMRHAGKVGTEYVMQAQTFFGPNERWVEFVPRGGVSSLATAPKEHRKAGSIPAPHPPILEKRIDGRPFIREILSKLAAAKGA